MPPENIQIAAMDSSFFEYVFCFCFFCFFVAEIAPGRNFCGPEEVRTLPKCDLNVNQSTLFQQHLIDMNNMHGVHL